LHILEKKEVCEQDIESPTLRRKGKLNRDQFLGQRTKPARGIKIIIHSAGSKLDNPMATQSVIRGTINARFNRVAHRKYIRKFSPPSTQIPP